MAKWFRNFVQHICKSWRSFIAYRYTFSRHALLNEAAKLNNKGGVILKKFTVAMLACAALLAGCQTAPAGDPVANKVEAALKKDEFVGKFDIKAEHKDGKVILTGNVNNEFQSYQAETIAKGVEGVKSVENNIKEN